MTQLFRRKMRLRIAGDRIITGLHVRFHIEKTIRVEPNNAEIDVINLARSTREALSEIGSRTEFDAVFTTTVGGRVGPAGFVPVEFSAGYDEGPGTEPPMLFAGDLRELYSFRDGPDWITHMAVGDGEEAKKKARVKKALKGKVPVSKVVEVAVDALRAKGIGVSQQAEDLIRNTPPLEDAGKEHFRRSILDGNAFEQLEKVLENSGLEGWIHFNELQIVRRGRPLSLPPVRITPASGLVGSPEIGSKGLLKFRSLLIPDILPGRVVEVDSDLVTGSHRVERVVYAGDSAGIDWYCDVEARAL